MLIGMGSIARLLLEGARGGIANLGVVVGEKAHIEELGIYGRLIRSAPSLHDALERAVLHYPTFCSNGRLSFRPHGEDEIEFSHAFDHKIDGLDQGWEHTDHYVLMVMLGIVRLAGSDWRPTEVHLRTGESGAIRDVGQFAATRILFGAPSTSFTFPRALLDRPFPKPDVDRSVSPERMESWRVSSPARDFVQSVIQAVEMLSWEEYPDIHQTAEFLGVSVRTLQRYLADAGTTHESLVGRARFTMAAAVLEETDTKILEIALDLGYSDHAHFTRAFRRWAGSSPREYRRRLRRRARGSNAASA
jgi:AraC-like DNA-binding protein